MNEREKQNSDMRVWAALECQKMRDKLQKAIPNAKITYDNEKLQISLSGLYASYDPLEYAKYVRSRLVKTSRPSVIDVPYTIRGHGARRERSYSKLDSFIKNFNELHAKNIAALQAEGNRAKKARERKELFEKLLPAAVEGLKKEYWDTYNIGGIRASPRLHRTEECIVWELDMKPDMLTREQVEAIARIMEAGEQ